MHTHTHTFTYVHRDTHSERHTHACIDQVGPDNWNCCILYTFVPNGHIEVNHLTTVFTSQQNHSLDQSLSMAECLQMQPEHHLFTAVGQWVARRPKVLGTPAALGALMHCDVHVLTHCDVHVLTHCDVHLCWQPSIRVHKLIVHTQLLV